jgi:hypothetical protein
MAADQERAQRIRALKSEHPELTWQAIADHVGVTMRAAQAWGEKGEIAYGNARKLAELFGEDVAFILRGPPPTSPDLMGAIDADPVRHQLDRIEARLNTVARALEGASARALRGDPIRGLEDLVQQLRDDPPPVTPPAVDARSDTGR